ncbi:MAG: phosphate signaling complex protein PhoU [Deltaproteobacteria bacterium]|jgi:phosphate transport system protein|nr:phosphate signaling complex protein PhoU [Deltaproteobacteria bacterium]
MIVGKFEIELDKLSKQVKEMGVSVLKMLKGAGEALLALDDAKATEVIKSDKTVNDLENVIVNRAITLIATNQPVAKDLRFLASSLRLAIELERIGDLGSNLARRAQDIILLEKDGEPTEPLPADIPLMVKKALSMLEMALYSLEHGDTATAEEVFQIDDVLDDLNKTIRAEALSVIKKDGHKAAWGYEVITIASHLERLADHATNLAEETVYMAKGLNIRHNY